MFRLFRFLLLWLVIALAGCTPYVEYHRETSEPQPSATIAEGRTPVYRTGVLTYSPDGGSLDLVLERIESAKTRVWLATYILSEKRVMQALENAQARDVDVRVMLEPEVYNLPTINRAAFDRLSKKGIDVQWISAPTVGLHHAKYLIIDDGYILSTANFSHSSFTENREYFFAGNHPRDLESLERLFESDRT
ncbi:MAG TPA: phospholipase D-like domain-containing protein [bacterium]|nr:phospholipase D-like domain-containing protein [bacterium]